MAIEKYHLAKNYICSPTSKMKKSSFPMYNCNYDVTQNTDMKILKIDETTLSNVTNIVSKIEAEIENKFPAKGSDKKVSEGLKDPVIYDKIRHVMQRYKEENITKVPGEINITITKPIKCNNPCEGDNANPLITDEVIIDKMIEGRLNKFYQENVLLEQNFVKDPDKTIQDLLSDTISTLGENIEIRRFSRFQLGELSKPGKNSD